MGEPSHRKHNLNRNPLNTPQPTQNVNHQYQQNPRLSGQKPEQPRQDNPKSEHRLVVSSQGMDFTTPFARKPENYPGHTETVGQRPEHKQYFGDGSDTFEGNYNSDGTPHWQNVYTNGHMQTTQRVWPHWFITPRNPSNRRRWVPYTHSTAPPKESPANGAIPSTANPYGRGTRGRMMHTKETRESSNAGYDVTKGDDVITGLETNERKGYVSDGNLTDGNQGNESYEPEARDWTGPIRQNLNTKHTTGPIHDRMDTKRNSSTSHASPSPMPPDTYSTPSPNETKSPIDEGSKPLPPLAPLTTLPPVTTYPPFGRVYNPYDPRGDGSYPDSHGEGYHHDGDMDQYYKDYRGNDDGNPFQGYMRPEGRQAPDNGDFGNGEFYKTEINQEFECFFGKTILWFIFLFIDFFQFFANILPLCLDICFITLFCN